MNKSLFNNKYARLLALSVVIFIAISFIQDFSSFLDENSDKTVKLGSNPLCDPMTSVCSASIVTNGEFQRLSLSITALNAAQHEYLLTVKASGFDFEGIESLAVLLQEQANTRAGTDIQTVLLSPDKNNKLVVPEHWVATARIEAKSKSHADKTEATVWQATIRLKSTQKEYRAEFRFKTYSGRRNE